MTTSKLKLTANFADETKREVQIGTLGSNAVVPSNIRAKVREFNANIADIEDLYLSDSGANCTGITKASIITTTERKFNLNED